MAQEHFAVVDIAELDNVLDDRAVFASELCHACGVHAELVIEMVDEGLIEPRGAVSTEWRSSGSAVTRAQKALTLVRGLLVDWPVAALALDLLEEVERLRVEQRRVMVRIDRIRHVDR